MAKSLGGMVDVGGKRETKRRAVAVSTITMKAKAFKSFRQGDSPKGDVLEAAKIAGIMAAKSTPSLIPMCHPLEITKVKIAFDVNEENNSITSMAEVLCLGKTGVEMEALVAAAVSSLTIYDMMKWADQSMSITETHLLSKSGGQSGDYKRG